MSQRVPLAEKGHMERYEGHTPEFQKRNRTKTWSCIPTAHFVLRL